MLLDSVLPLQLLRLNQVIFHISFDISQLANSGDSTSIGTVGIRTAN